MKTPRDIAYEALELPPSDREDYLFRVCGDPELRQRVDELLAAAAGESRDLPTVVSAGNGEDAVGDLSGSQIGRYKLLQLIGEGGFGSVYMAEQVEPVQRRVALKIIKLGMDTKQVIARFEAERQALAMMDHPNIARVLDAGSTETGRPYFVMELVQGIALTEYCDRHSLDIPERLKLFIDVCHAVQHAHQKGVIHRDLKPSNILVTLKDGPVPKVIDFGIAKATHHRLTEKTLFTEFRQFVGTPQYMSPEQAEMSGLDIDTRSDVYSLGVVLYELLSGATPFDSETLFSGGYAEIQRVIREEDPPRLSTRFTEREGQQESVAKHRGTEPDRLRQSLRGELEWIVSRALEKDRTRRYETASEFALDIEPSLKNEPVQACPPSTIYRFRKFVRRHCVGVVTSTLVILALVAGFVAAGIGLYQANRELTRSKAISTFLTELQVGFDPVRAGSGDIPVEQLIERCESLFGDDHAAIGSLLFTRGSVLESSGRSEEAVAVFERCLEFQRNTLGAEHESVGATLSALAGVVAEQGHIKRAQELYEHCLAIYEKRFGALSLRVGETCGELTELLMMSGGNAEDVSNYFRRTTEALTAVRADDHRTAELYCAYGAWLQATGDLTGALPILNEAIKRGSECRERLGDSWIAALNSLTITHVQRGDNDAAKPVYTMLIEELAKRGVTGPAMIIQYQRFAYWLLSIGDLEGAVAQAQKGADHAREELPVDDSVRHDAIRTLLDLRNRQDETEITQALFQEWLAGREAKYGRNSEEHRSDLTRYADWLREKGQEERALEIEAERESLGKD